MNNVFPHTATKEEKNVVASAMVDLYDQKEKERKINNLYNGLEFARYTVVLKDGTVKKYQGKKFVVQAVDRFQDEIDYINVGW